MQNRMTSGMKANAAPDAHEGEIFALRKELAECRAALAAALEQNEAANERQRQYQVIVEASRDAIWSWDSDGTITSWNKEAERQLGYAADEICGRSLLTLVPPERMQLAQEALAKLRVGGWYGQYETERLHKDGRRLPVELTVSPIHDSGGAIIGAATVCRDIGARKQAESALAGRMNELAALYTFTDRLRRAESQAASYEAALQAIQSALGCDRASILLFDDAGVMRFVAWHGLSDDYRYALEGHSPWKAGDREPDPIVVSDIAETAEPDWIKATIMREGIRALAFVPLLVQGRVVGKFMSYYAEPRRFTDHEVELATTIARQLGFTLERARADAARQLAEEELRHSEERFRLMSEQAPVMIWMSDADGACLHLNRMLREFWGVGDGAASELNWQDTMHPDDAAAIGRAMQEALVSRVAVSIKGRYRRADGRYRVLQTDARPRISAKGEFLGMIGVNVDVTERDEAEAALRESEEHFRRAVEAAPSGMVMTDADGRITMVNAHAERLFGYSRGEMVGQSIERLVPERFRRSHPAFRSDYAGKPTARAMGAGRDLFALRKDGAEIAVEIGLSPIVTSKGLMTLAAVIDISARKQEEAHRELLLAELNHRVKNTLAVVQSIANQTFKERLVSSEAKRAFEGRLVALSAAHDLLTQSDWQSAALTELVAGTLQAHGGSASRVTLSGSPILLSPRQALALGLALHELFTNAVKYGALSNDSGRVEVAWERTHGADPRFSLVWCETGGPPVAEPKRRGFGSLLLDRMLAKDLDATVVTSFRPEGLVARITVPLAR
jgi:PAS domain S-box-containing protein